MEHECHLAQGHYYQRHKLLQASQFGSRSQLPKIPAERVRRLHVYVSPGEEISDLSFSSASNIYASTWVRGSRPAPWLEVYFRLGCHDNHGLGPRCLLSPDTQTARLQAWLGYLWGAGLRNCHGMRQPARSRQGCWPTRLREDSVPRRHVFI